MASVRIWQKKQVRLDRLNFKQTQMFRIGTVGVAAVKNRLAAAQGPSDAPAKPLTKRYAIQKTKLGLGNWWNLSFTGNMLRNLQVRTVSENKSRAGLSTRKDRIKAWANQRIEPSAGVLAEEPTGGAGGHAAGACGDEAATGGGAVLRRETAAK